MLTAYKYLWRGRKNYGLVQEVPSSEHEQQEKQKLLKGNLKVTKTTDLIMAHNLKPASGQPVDSR